MRGISLAGRIALIVIVSLTAVWIASLSALYWTRGGDMKFVRPSPERFATLAGMLEKADMTEQARLLTVVTSNWFVPRLISSHENAGPTQPAADPKLLARYVNGLEGRTISISYGPAPAESRRWHPFGARTARELEFRISLRTGQTLAVVARAPFPTNRFGLPVGFFAGFMGTLIALVALIVMRRETRPLMRLAAAVNQMDLSGSPIPPIKARRGAPEIQALVIAFNQLQDRLTALLRARMALIGGISHDVRTFATRLRLRADFIGDEKERQRAIADIDDMVRLLDDALLSSKAGAGELSQEIVEFSTLVQAEIKDRRAGGANVDFHSLTPANVLGDRLALRRIISNLIDNALKYGFVAHIAVMRHGDMLHFIVDDEGPGIAAEQREVMLEPFSRLEGSRSRNTGGAGLGLAIVRNLAEAHGGSVEIGNSRGGGARLLVKLPIFEPQAKAHFPRDAASSRPLLSSRR